MEQEGILKYFEERHRREVKRIDLSAKTGLAAMFNDDAVPMIILVYRL